MVVRRIPLGLVLVPLTAFFLTALLYHPTRNTWVDFERGYEDAFVAGFHPRERADGKFFRWTREISVVELHHLPEDARISATVRLKTIRPAGVELPSLSFGVNGVTVHRAMALLGEASYRFDFPSPGEHVRLSIESDTFEASGGRKLGVQVSGVGLSFSESASPSWLQPALFMALAAAFLTVAACSAGLDYLVAALAALALSLVFIHLLSLEALRFSTYPREVALLAAFTLVFVVLFRRLLTRLEQLSSVERVGIIAVSGLVLLLKLGVVFYPLMMSSDGDFQVHRMSEFLAGNWHPTSITQHDPPFRIPYPVSLYATAAPFAALGLSRVASLELVTVLFDTLVSLALVYLAWRFVGNLRGGLIAAGVYALVPINALSFSAGNYTNIFAVAMLFGSFTCLLLAADGSRKAGVASGVFACLALTAHFGMLLEGLVLWPAWLTMLWLDPASARSQRRIASFAIAAGFLAAGLYYLGYEELLTSQWDRAFSLEVTSPEVAGPAMKLALIVSLVGEQLGWVFSLAAALGALTLLRRPFESVFDGGACIWLGVSAIFFALDLFSSIGIRYILQSLPLLSLLAGLCLSRAMDRGRWGRIAAYGALAYLGAVGLTVLYEVAVFRYH